MAKTYLPTLEAIVHKLCRYMVRYEDTIRRNLSGEALLAYEALNQACTAFLAATGE